MWDVCPGNGVFAVPLMSHLRPVLQHLPRPSRASGEVGVRDGALKVALTAPPVDGAANGALLKLLSKELGVPKSAIEILRGERARTKLLRVHGVSPSALDFEDLS